MNKKLLIAGLLLSCATLSAMNRKRQREEAANDVAGRMISQIMEEVKNEQNLIEQSLIDLETAMVVQVHTNLGNKPTPRQQDVVRAKITKLHNN